MKDGPDAVRRLVDVSRETMERFEIYEGLLRQWQAKTNLVANASLDQFWTRHVADSVQPFLLKQKARRWIDLGSGAGFPGLVTAILLAERAGTKGASVCLIDSNSRKSAFLRAVSKETGLSAKGVAVRVLSARIEDVLPGEQNAEAVTARALSPLKNLLAMISLLPGEQKPVAMLHKGRGYESEIETARNGWSFNLEVHTSLIEGDSVVLEIKSLSSLDEMRGKHGETA